MKQFLFILTLTALGLSNPVLPSRHERYSAQVTLADIHPQSSYSRDDLQEGEVSVNLRSESIQLRLLLRPNGLSVLKEWEVSLRLRSVYTTSCGAKVYRGSTLLGSLSTTYQELIVTDFTDSHCVRPRRMTATTRIEYRQIDFTPGSFVSVDQRSAFEATELRLSL